MVEKKVCKNGLRIVSQHMPNVRSVSFGIWVNVGSRYEKAHENGLTHFIEHMLFKGTAKRSAKKIAEDFDRIGAQTNAFTAKDQTCYFSVALDHHIRETIEILADMFFHSTFDEGEMEKEKQVILEEIAMSEDTPDDDVDERLWAEMFPNQPLGAPILGTADTLASFSRDKVQNFMREHYTADQIVISVAGNLDDGLVAFIAELFNQFANDKQRKEITFDKPVFHAGHTVKKTQIEQAHLAIGYPGLAIDSEHLISHMVMNNIFGDSMSSRLFQKIREEKALAYTVYSYYSAYADAGAFMIYGGTSTASLKLMEETIFDVIEDFKEHGVTQEELTSAKSQIESNLLLGLETSYDFMTRNAKNEILHGYDRSVEESLKELDHVNVASIQQQIDTVFNNKYARSLIISE
ncbi:M16 family metallopeptidase [Kurthia sibirica]|uniref:Peptidase M16 n=1 Tax=Kurthia sibirica TaxID=202750 RepID=A0A2U3AQZ2_9BACL|nr:pitrilysin family protein [Kurthia sibirica]PWI26944.1 peptidase M16 [Kurthia sibirica]GEK32513.1 putative zinc protease YmxG [Kurthia sibirica]